MAAPNTLAIMSQIISLIEGLGLYKTVVLEAQKDWTDAWPVCEVHFLDDRSEHFAAGGTIRDTQGFKITSAVSFTTQTPAQAITTLTTLRDNVTYLFQQHAYLGGLAGVDDSRVRPDTHRTSFVTANGDLYLVHEMIIEVESTWTVPIGVNSI